MNGVWLFGYPKNYKKQRSPNSNHRQKSDSRLISRASRIKSTMKEMNQSTEVISLSSDEEASPLQPIFILKTRNDTKPFEDTHDCFILDFDPSDPINGCIADLSLSFDEDVSVISEKGQVACRDYPHSRHLCAEYPFEKTPHESFCKLCYCYVCDTAAPCKFWKDPKSAHCDATDQSDTWKSLRRLQAKLPIV